MHGPPTLLTNARWGAVSDDRMIGGTDTATAQGARAVFLDEDQQEFLLGKAACHAAY